MTITSPQGVFASPTLTHCARQAVRVAAIVLSLAGATNAFAAGTTILSANFNTKTVDAPIGAGGPTVGEPVALDANIGSVVVGPGPFATNSLRLQGANSTRTIRFGFLDGQEITAGQVTIAVTLKPSALDAFAFSVREPDTSGSSFSTIRLNSAGSILLSDAGVPGAVSIGTYAANDVMAFEIIFNQNTHTYDIRLNGNLLVDDRAHGVSTGRGIGSILLGSGASYGGNALYVDDILVTLISETVFKHGFE